MQENMTHSRFDIFSLSRIVDMKEPSVTTKTIDLGRKTLSIVREVGSGLYLNKQNASCEVLSELEQIRGLRVKN